MKKLILALAVATSGTASATTKVIKISTLAYPGTSLNRYIQDLETTLLTSESAQRECPNGVAKISKVTTAVTADFAVKNGTTQAQTYPKISIRAEVECK